LLGQEVGEWEVTVPHVGFMPGGRAAGRTSSPDPESHADVLASIEVALAGALGCRAIGIDSSGGDSDYRVAATLARRIADSSEEAVEILLRAHDRVEGLVATERFKMLAVALGTYLHEHGSVQGPMLVHLMRRWDHRAISGVRGATLQQFASWHPSPWTDRTGSWRVRPRRLGNGPPTPNCFYSFEGIDSFA
jgi:hypothetical protein